MKLKKYILFLFYYILGGKKAYTKNSNGIIYKGKYFVTNGIVRNNEMIYFR